jgi:uncharacterized protein (DUF697 family)
MKLDDGHVIKPIGLDDLVSITMDLVPDAVKDAVARALNTRIQAALDSKRKRANVAVLTAVGLATAIGATPIPFADAALLVPVHVVMLATISGIWGLDITEAALTTIISGAVASVSGTLGGRALVAGILKLIPGIGTAAGAVISASTAATITAAFGEIYIASLYTLSKKHPDQMPTAEEVRNEFRSRLSRRQSSS